MVCPKLWYKFNNNVTREVMLDNFILGLYIFIHHFFEKLVSCHFYTTRAKRQETVLPCSCAEHVMSRRMTSIFSISTLENNHSAKQHHIRRRHRFWLAHLPVFFEGIIGCHQIFRCPGQAPSVLVLVNK